MITGLSKNHGKRRRTMKKLNLNQKKAVSELLINLSTAFISIGVVSQIFIEKQLTFYSLILSFTFSIISTVMIYHSINIFKKSLWTIKQYFCFTVFFYYSCPLFYIFGQKNNMTTINGVLTIVTYLLIIIIVAILIRDARQENKKK